MRPSLQTLRNAVVQKAADSAGAYEDDEFHHRKWALLSVAHAAETYGNLLLCVFDPSHPQDGRYLSFTRMRRALMDHESLSPIERECSMPS